MELTAYVDRNVNKALNFFWVGYVIYIVAFVFPASKQSDYFIIQGMQLFGVLLFLPSSLAIIQWKFESNYLRIIFSIYILWSFIVIIRGFQFNYEFIKNMLLSAWIGLFIYFTPFILLFPKNIGYLKKVFNVILILSFFYGIYDLLFYRVLLWGFGGNRYSTGVIEYFSHFLSISSGFILLTYIYHKNKRILIAIFVVILTFILASIRARRGLMFMTVSILLASYIIYYFTNRGKILRVILSVFLLFFIVIYGRQVYSSNSSGMFGLISGRMDEDTRSGVEDYFKSNMSPLDWLIGRGINGQYYCPGIDEVAGSVTINRDVIETGYLQIILKGGLISLILFLLIALPAIFKGFFYSENVLSKAAATWILLFILYMYPATINLFTMNYLIIWLSIGICYSKELRALSNDKIIELLS